MTDRGPLSTWLCTGCRLQLARRRYNLCDDCLDAKDVPGHRTTDNNNKKEH